MGIKFRAKPWRHVAPQWPHYRSASGWLLRRLEMVCNTCRSVAWLVPQITVAKIASSMLCDNSKHMGLSENVGQKPFHPLVNHNFPYQRCHTSDVHPLISNKPSHGYESKPLKNRRYLLVAIGFGCLFPQTCHVPAMIHPPFPKHAQVSASKAEVASSSSRSAGFRQSARAMHNRCASEGVTSERVESPMAVVAVIIII